MRPILAPHYPKWLQLFRVAPSILLLLLMGVACEDKGPSTGLQQLNGNWQFTIQAGDGIEAERDLRMIISGNTITFLPLEEEGDQGENSDVEGGYISGNTESFKIILEAAEPSSRQGCQEAVVRKEFEGDLSDSRLSGTYIENRISAGEDCREVDIELRRVLGGTFSAIPVDTEGRE